MNMNEHSISTLILCDLCLMSHRRTTELGAARQELKIYRTRQSSDAPARSAPIRLSCSYLCISERTRFCSADISSSYDEDSHAGAARGEGVLAAAARSPAEPSRRARAFAKMVGLVSALAGPE